jgi:glutathione-independent formaldehyde dehydrogenase
MRAVVYKGKNKVAVEEVPDPKTEAPGDAIIRITTAAICGSGLHMYDERSNAEKGTVFGHENQGTVEKAGKSVVSIKKGDRVVLPFNIACGFCMNCASGFTNACLTANPVAPTAGSDMPAWGHIEAGRPSSGGSRLRILIV